MASGYWLSGLLVTAVSFALPKLWQPSPETKLWTRTFPQTSAKPCANAEEALLAGRDRATQVIDESVARSLQRPSRFYGLSLLRGAIEGDMVALMREDALYLLRQGRLTPSGDPNEPQLTEQYKRYLGSLPVLTILDPQRAAAEGLVGLAYGAAFLTGVCGRLNELGSQPLEPGTLQLACYDGEGVAYHVHEDYVPQKDYNPEDLPEHHRLAYKRRVTAILYLQEDWRENLGGSFRAHAVRPERDDPPPADYVDVLPEGGSLILFRSDMPHEVLPTHGQRFALSMWCHADG